MKKAERILGWSGLILFVLGVLFRIMHWPGAGISLSIAVMILALGYLPLQLILERRETNSRLKIIYLVFRFSALFLILTSFAFKVQHLPGAGILYISATLLIPALIIFYLFIAKKGLTVTPLRLNTIILFVVGYFIYVFVNASNVSISVVDGYLVLEEQFSKTNAGLQSANAIIYESLEVIQDSSEALLMESIRELEEISLALTDLIENIRREFLSLFAMDTDEQDLYNYSRRLMSGSNLSGEFFIVQGNAYTLRIMLEQFETEVKEIQTRHQIPGGLIGIGFDLDDQLTTWGDTIIWEERMLGRKPVAACFSYLSWIEQVALINENTLLNELINQFDMSQESHLIRELANKESQRAIDLKENEILRISQQQELQHIQLETARTELRQRNLLLVLSFIGIAFVLILLFISSRAYIRKQKDMLALEKQKKEIEVQRDEIEAQRDEIEAQRDEIESQRDLVQNHKEQIEKTHHEISSSIDYAMRLQDAMLPSPALLEEYFSGHLVFFRPKQKVSGDFYWWTRYGSSLVIAVADCTGHGVPGAFMSLLGASLLKEIVNREGITTPGRILDRLREEVIAALDQKGSMNEQKDGMDMSLVSIDPESHRCEFAGANNPLYLQRRGQLSTYRADLMPLSYYEEMRPFNTTEIQLEPGDQLYLFSDGYADQFGGTQRKKFKYKNFRQVIGEYADLSMPRQQQVLSDTIREWQGKYEQTDDMVIVGIRI